MLLLCRTALENLFAERTYFVQYILVLEKVNAIHNGMRELALHHSVKVVHADDELLEEPPRFTLLQAPFPHDILKHVPSCYIFHGNGQVSRCQEHLQAKPA